MKSNLERHKFRIPLSFLKSSFINKTSNSFELKLSQEKHSTSLKVHSFSSIDKFYLNQDLNYKVYTFVNKHILLQFSSAEWVFFFHSRNNGIINCISDQMIKMNVLKIFYSNKTISNCANHSLFLF